MSAVMDAGAVGKEVGYFGWDGRFSPMHGFFRMRANRFLRKVI